MDKQFLKDSFGWGMGLWGIGYLAGFVLFFIVSVNLIGWVIMPFGVLITLWVLFKKVKGENMAYYFKISVAWTIIAVVFDYLFLVLLLKPADGYYKFDVYLYYLLTFAMPLAVGALKTKNRRVGLDKEL